MIYYSLIFLLRLAIHAFFRKVDLIGKENLPKKGAAVFVVNHPNALIDPILVAIIAGRQLHYIAGAEFFGNKLTSWFLRKHCNMVPVYRPHLQKGEPVSNDHMFEYCYETLTNNGVIIIFSEGVSEVERRIKKLKSGTVRMVLGAEKLTGIKIPIIPIGLNYADSFRFQSDVLISVGESFTLDEVDGIEEKEIVKKHTARVRERLIQQVIHLEDEMMATTIDRLEHVLLMQLNQEDNWSNKEKSKKKFKMTREVIETIDYFKTESPELILSIQNRLGDYYNKIQEISMQGRSMNLDRKRSGFIEIISIVLLFPLFVVGFAINAIPYYLADVFFKKKFLKRIIDPESNKKIRFVFRRSISFSVGVILFLVWYIMLSFITFNFFSFWGVMVFLAIAYVSGLYALRYIEMSRTVKDRFSFRKTLRIYPAEMEELIRLRHNIIEEVKGLIEKFRNEIPK